MSADLNLETLLYQIAEERGVDFRGYKRSTLERRFSKRMSEVKAQNYSQYAEYLRAQPEEVNELLNTVLINITELESHQPGDTIRCWSAGCASGEEPYSMAILLAEHFGPRLTEYDIKIYGTDIDEDALAVARRAEYSQERLLHVRPDWRKKYFHGDKLLRVNRDLRRICIFGRSNILSDAPISHVDLLTCRNLLIYFNAQTQRQIVNRLHYALEPRGILFIGKASSLPNSGQLFRPIDSKYRIFQRADGPFVHDVGGTAAALEVQQPDHGDILRLQHAALLETLESGVVILDAKDVVISQNDSASRLWGIKGTLATKPVQDTDLGSLCPDLAFHLEETRSNHQTVSFTCSAGAGNRSRTLSVTLKPMVNPGSQRVGTVVYMEDISPREKLQTTIEELQSTGEELQSANEELETTNEELQSANEELETTNEELQSTNEELETTNEELQSLNEELQTANEELGTRSKEMDELNARYAETLERMPWPVMVIGERLRIDFWNEPARALFGFHGTPAAELRLEQLPVPAKLRSRLVRRHRATLARNARSILRDEVLGGPKSRNKLNVHFMPLSGDGRPHSVLIMFEITGEARAEDAAPRRNRNQSTADAAAASGPGNRDRGARKPRSRRK
jgi:two-component system CheB/CheR fusion protein